MGKKIGLDVPERTKPDRKAFSIRPKKVASWIEALPRANLGETSRQIYTVLRETNGLKFSNKDRTRFLESMREPVDYVTRSMKKHFVGISLPLPEKSQKITAITKELFSSMATGYMIALEDMLDEHLVIIDKKPLAMLVQRAMFYISQLMLTSYQSYSLYSSRYWGELHKLYLFAEDKGILKTKVTDELRNYSDKSTVAQEYSRILMISLASPNHLRQGEAGKVYDALERWLDQPVIRKLNAKDKTTGNFFDNLAQSSAPSALSLSITEDLLDLSQLRIIHTQDIANKLEQESGFSEESGSTTLSGIEMSNQTVSSDLIKRLLIAWGMASKRVFPRKNKAEVVGISIGLSAAHQFIFKKAQPNAMETGQFTNMYDQRAHFESTEIKLNLNNPTETHDDVWGVIYPDDAAQGMTPLVEKEFSLQEEVPISQERIESEVKQYEMDSWVIVNESLKGIMIRNSNDMKNKAQVGELVSIRRKTTEKTRSWGIGVIRWIKYNQDKSMQMGIEIINPNAAAIGIRPASNPNAPLSRTIMLPEIKNLRQPASLITNPANWRVGNKILINMLGKNIHATLTKQVQNTGLFAQFLFEIDNGKPKQDEPEQDETHTNYENIWSTI